MSKNECGKMRDKDNPYEIWKGNGFEWRVLKKYQKPELEAKNPSMYRRLKAMVKRSFLMTH